MKVFELKYVYYVLAALLLTSCFEEIELDLEDYEPEIVVEAYINDRFPQLNYVILTKSIDFFNPDLKAGFVPSAIVTITDGGPKSSSADWENGTVYEFTEFNIEDSAGGGMLSVYVDPSLNFIAQAGNQYRLDIVLESGEHIYATTTLPELVEIDSVSYRFPELNGGIDSAKGRLRVYFTDPNEFGNYYRQFLKTGSDFPLTWGRMNNDNIFDDTYFNGTQYRFDYLNDFSAGDTTHIFLSSLDHASYQYWLTYSQSVNSGGPFAAPITVASNVEGGLGVFCGLSVSYKRVTLEP